MLLFAHDIMPFERQILPMIDFIFDHFVFIYLGFVVLVGLIIWTKVRKLRR